MKNKKDLLDQGIFDVELAAEQEEIKSRKFKYGTLATIFTVLFIIGVVLVNVLVGYLTDRFVLEVDLTSENLFEISEDTKEVIAGLTEPVDIIVFADETRYKNSTELLSNIYETLQRYESLSGGMIKVQYLDPNLNPGVVDKYNALNDLTSDDIVVASERRFKRLQPTSLYNHKTGEDGITYYVGLRAEQKITSALLYVTADKLDKALYIRGHNEDYGLDELSQLLTYSNYEVNSFILAREEIPEDCTMLIISSPLYDYSAEEVDKISDFLDKGGKLIVSMNPNTLDPMTNLSLLFEEWGVKYDSEIILDSSQSLSGYPMYVVPTTVYFEGISDTINIQNRFAMIPACKPIQVTGTQKAGIDVHPLLVSSATSYSKSIEDTIAGTDKLEGDTEGPFNMCVLAEKIASDKNLNYTRADILFCSTGMITDSILSAPEFLNGTWLTAALNYVSEYTDAVIIPDKNFESKALTILSWQGRLVFWVVVVAIPLIVIAAGVIVWARRRHL